MYIDLIVGIKNAEQAGKPGLALPFSKLDFAVAKVLVDAGYISGAEKKMVGRKDILEIRLSKINGSEAISDFKIVSKPSRRVYVDYRNIKPVRQGYGIGIISTPMGVMSSKEAKKKKVGGEYLLQVW